MAGNFEGLEAIILAGGLGTRLRSVVSELPKPLAPVGGRPFLEHQLAYWTAQGVERFILSVGYKGEMIQGRLGSSFQGAVLDYINEVSPLGTGGGLLSALELVQSKERVIILNGDTLCETRLAAMEDCLMQKRADLTMALVKVQPGSRYGGVTLANGQRITEFIANGTGPAPLANGGVYLARPGAFLGLGWRPGQKVSLESQLFPRMLEQGRRLFGLVVEGRFIDIGTPEDYRAAQALF